MRERNHNVRGSVRVVFRFVQNKMEFIDQQNNYLLFHMIMIEL
jgi:hypothetical protein